MMLDDVQSKKSAKKMERKQQLKRKIEQKKLLEKQSRKIEVEERIRIAVSKRENMTPEMLLEDQRTRKEARETRKCLHLEQKLLFQKAQESNCHVVFDLQFVNLMSEKELNSLLRQLMLIYSMNGKSQSPVKLVLSSYSEYVENQLMKFHGSENWFIEKTQSSFNEHYADRIHSLVYLTADSEEEIESIDDGIVYVVGGLVDRNRHKGATWYTAQETEIRTRKIPVKKYVQLVNGFSEVLTVNQVRTS
mmetsp:Transcript_35176/g.109943  ORF Transcript_35176/g.109943 Transcript_35176/m.109943 type:complete len:248 (-) Transcript_35176:171-914(-)